MPLFVKSVEAGAPASLAGLKEGDVVTKLDRQPAKSLGMFADSLASKGSSTVTLTVTTKATSTKSVSYKLELPFSGSKLGMSISENKGGGVLVDTVDAGGAASAAGIVPGVVVTKLNGQDVTGLTTFLQVKGASEGTTFKIQGTLTTETGKSETKDIKVRLDGGKLGALLEESGNAAPETKKSGGSNTVKKFVLAGVVGAVAAKFAANRNSS